MGTLHHLPSNTDAQARLLEHLVSNMIGEHPEPEVARRWAQMASESISRYPGPPLPSQPVLDLTSIKGLNDEQTKAISEQCDRWLQSYFDDVRQQLMLMHKDLLMLQKTVAEHESS